MLLGQAGQAVACLLLALRETWQLGAEGREIHFLLLPSAAAPFQAQSCSWNLLSQEWGDQKRLCFASPDLFSLLPLHLLIFRGSYVRGPPLCTRVVQSSAMAVIFPVQLCFCWAAVSPVGTSDFCWACSSWLPAPTAHFIAALLNYRLNP